MTPDREKSPVKSGLSGQPDLQLKSGLVRKSPDNYNAMINLMISAILRKSGLVRSDQSRRLCSGPWEGGRTPPYRGVLPPPFRYTPGIGQEVRP
jgi:hypothetical protein